MLVDSSMLHFSEQIWEWSDGRVNTKPVKAEYRLHDVILTAVTSATYLGSV